MGDRGPVPKRSSERRRRNKESQTESAAFDGPAVVAPDPSPEWHEIARDWFVSLSDSGQSQFFEPSDWQAARLVAESMSRNLTQAKFSSVLFAAVWSAMSDLLTTEASRRRVRMEIERGPVDESPPAGVTALAEYRRQLGS